MTCEIDGRLETMAVRSPRFRRWLIGWIFVRYRKAPYNQALEETLRTIEALAEFDGPVRLVHLRVAGGERRPGAHRPLDRPPAQLPD